MTLTPILETTELTIYGSPDTISIVTDIGSKGDRGSLIFSNIGHPNTFTDNVSGIYKLLGEILYGRDIYYRIDTDQWYQWTGNAWVLKSGIQRFFKLKQSGLAFNAGEASVTIPIASLWNDTSITINNVLVFVQATSTTPSFVSVKSKSIVGTDLIIDLYGFTLNIVDATTSILSDPTDIDFIISLV